MLSWCVLGDIIFFPTCSIPAKLKKQKHSNETRCLARVSLTVVHKQPGALGSDHGVSFCEMQASAGRFSIDDPCIHVRSVVGLVNLYAPLSTFCSVNIPSGLWVPLPDGRFDPPTPDSSTRLIKAKLNSGFLKHIF